MPRHLKNTKRTKQNTSKKTIFVGLSGGVDSSVAAYLLKKSGYNVVGAFIKIWVYGTECSWKDDRRSAMRVAAQLNIPFVTIDLSKEYERDVVDYMIDEYKAGRTPNPDVMCNREIKFNAFYKKTIELGADLIATGHYAITKDGLLYKALDKSKEQSYFLYNIRPAVIKDVVFPIGNLKKDKVRSIARRAGLHTFEKKDSQGLCFIGKVSIKEFLKGHIGSKQGNVLDTKGEIVGVHNGASLYTLGERHGFTITRKGTDDVPFYVVSKDVKSNTITVAPHKVSTSHHGEKLILGNNEFVIRKCNWISERPKAGKSYDAQIRYHGEYERCLVEIIDQETARVTFNEPKLVASGQSIVVYDKNLCLGGGVVEC